MGSVGRRQDEGPTTRDCPTVNLAQGRIYDEETPRAILARLVTSVPLTPERERARWRAAPREAVGVRRSCLPAATRECERELRQLGAEHRYEPLVCTVPGISAARRWGC
jgi:hypothetical protein